MPTSTRKTSASDFIRSMPPDLRPSEVVARGAARGLRFSENLVYKARGRAKAPEARPDGGRGTAPVARPSKPDLSEMLVEYIAERPGRRLDELYTHFGGDRLLLRATLDALSAAKKLRTIGRGRNTTYMVQGAQAATRRTPSASRPAVKAPRARVTRSVAVEPAAGEIAPRTVDATSVEPPVGPLAVDDGPAAEPAGAAVPAPVIAETIEGEDLDAAVNALGQLLGEAAPQALQDLRVVVRRFGLDLARAAYQKTVEIEAGEGMVRDGRRKTPGGVFFYLAKTRAGREQLGPGFADLRPIRVDPPTPVPAAPRETASPPSASSVELMNAMVMFIAKNPGLREEQIRSRLAGDRRLVRATLDALRTQKRVKMVGSGRAAVFVVPD